MPTQDACTCQHPPPPFSYPPQKNTNVDEDAVFQWNLLLYSNAVVDLKVPKHRQMARAKGDRKDFEQTSHQAGFCHCNK